MYSIYSFLYFRNILLLTEVFVFAYITLGAVFVEIFGMIMMPVLFAGNWENLLMVIFGMTLIFMYVKYMKIDLA